MGPLARVVGAQPREAPLRLDRRPELTVRDTGVGIPDDELPRVFDRFHRVASTRGRSLEGTGIGLSLAQELVKLHGGSVRVESAVGRGTTFVVSIPLGTAHLPEARVATGDTETGAVRDAHAFVDEAHGWASPTRSSTRLAAAPREHSAPHARVLLADDNADMRAHIARLLAPSFEVEGVADGQEALDARRSGWRPATW